MPKATEPGLYRHYKGGIYEVISIATHSETLEIFVVYKACYQPEGENLWVRPLQMFVETIDIEGKQINRFTRVES
jgi:hypothetical protein